VQFVLLVTATLVTEPQLFQDRVPQNRAVTVLGVITAVTGSAAHAAHT
jgi:hypothetical protein